MRSSSPILSCFDGLARSPFTSMCPPSTASEACDRVLKKRAAHSHLSTRMRDRYASRTLRACVAMAVLVAACDRGANRAASPARNTVAAAPSAADTIVRRVVRRVRRQSAIQRVTQGIRASRALDALDSALVVRVYDQRGSELSDVPVAWTLANGGEGAVLRVVSTRTDSMGLSRALFTPGTSADTQHVFATVDSVGR